VREGNGCATALTRLEHVASAASGTPAGNDAMYEAGKCYQALGNLEASNTRFRRVQSAAGYNDRAASEIASNNRTAEARAKSMAAAAAAGPVAAPARPAPATRPASVTPAASTQ
jgi:hypothetical protein